MGQSTLIINELFPALIYVFEGKGNFVPNETKIEIILKSLKYLL